MIDKTHIIRNYKSDNVTSYIVDFFYNEIVSKEDQMLFDLAFADHIEQEKLEQFLKNWDIEKYDERKSLLLSYVMKENPHLKFSLYEKPRLEGLLKFHRFHNLKLITHYVKIVRALNSENIVPLIFKGGAMKHIRPNLPRHMGDIDILLSTEDDFLRTCQIAKDLGYIYEEFVRDHSFDLHLPDSTDGTVDIHRYVNFGVKYDKKFTAELFSRSTKENVFGVEAFVPCFEDLLFLGIVNMARNLNNKTSIGGILFYLFDFKFLIRSKENFNWNLVLQNIAKTNTGAQAFFAMKFVNKIIPGMLPEILLNNKSINKKFFSYCNHVVFEHLYFADLKQKSKKLSLKNAFKNLDSFTEYLIKKPQYFIIKRLIRKNSFLITIFLSMNSKKQVRFLG